MIDKMIVVMNDYITVSYSFGQEAVFVTNKKPESIKPFGGYDLAELFDAFCKTFSESTCFNDAIEFFKPTLGNYVVNK